MLIVCSKILINIDLDRQMSEQIKSSKSKHLADCYVLVQT